LVTAAAVSLMAAAAVIFGVPPRTASAQAGSVFTMTAAYNGFNVPNGVVIVNQNTGAVSVCSTQASTQSGNPPNNPTSNATCELRGRVIPGSGTSSLTVTGTYGSVFILNNQSGLLIECTTFGQERCVSDGLARR
jgi:hypothetical protein